MSGVVLGSNNITINGRIMESGKSNGIKITLDTISKTQVETLTGVNGWRLVRFLPPTSSVWYSGNDNLEGTRQLNHATRLMTQEWTVLFGTFNEYCFSTLNFAHWLYCTKDAVTGAFYDNSLRPILKSSTSNVPYSSRWYNRQGNSEDPIISIGHYDDRIMYSEASNGFLNRNLIPVDGGMCVWVRSSTDTQTTIQPITINSDYKYISFPNTGGNQTPYTITFTEETECDILVVGGGGAGGKFGGGGGAGSVLFRSNILLNGTISIQVGRGGVGSISHDKNGENGTLSKINISGIDYIADGGGGGGTREQWNTGYRGRAGNSGGSGGGGSHSNGGGSIIGGITTKSTYTYTNWITNGFNGGNGRPNTSGGNPNHASGGGGGAGGLGKEWDSTGGGNGGLGIQYISLFGTGVGHNGFFGGGGGGNTWRDGGDVGYANGGNGLFGGGGNGGLDGGIDISGEDGIAGTGGGGGGSKWDRGSTEDLDGGDGGSGIVIIRYRSSISDVELINRSEKHVVNNGILTNASYLDNINNFTYDINNRYPYLEIKEYKLIKIIVTSIIFLESDRKYLLNINLGINTLNTTYYVTNLKIEGGITVNDDKNNIYNFTTTKEQGGFYRFSFITIVLPKSNMNVRFNIRGTGTDNFNYIDYLYGGSLLNNRSDLNAFFKNVLYKNNTQHSFDTIVNNYLSSIDFWGIDNMYRNRDAKISQLNSRDMELTDINTGNIRAYNNVINLINTRNFSGIYSGNNNWFNTANPTLNQNVYPSSIFTGYTDVNYITYEKIEGITNTTPTIDRTVDVVGANFQTNFQTNNGIDTASIYVLR
jgi:hypothetical protein